MGTICCKSKIKPTRIHVGAKPNTDYTPGQTTSSYDLSVDNTNINTIQLGRPSRTGEKVIIDWGEPNLPESSDEEVEIRHIKESPVIDLPTAQPAQPNPVQPVEQKSEPKRIFLTRDDTGETRESADTPWPSKVSVSNISMRPKSDGKSIRSFQSHSTAGLTIEELDTEDSYSRISATSTPIPTDVLATSHVPKIVFDQTGPPSIQSNSHGYYKPGNVKSSDPETQILPVPVMNSSVAIVRPLSAEDQETQIHVPKDIYEQDLKRMRRKRKRKLVPRRRYDDTPRVPKPGDPFVNLDTNRLKTEISLSGVTMRPASNISDASGKSGWTYETGSEFSSRPGTASTKISFGADSISYYEKDKPSPDHIDLERELSQTSGKADVISLNSVSTLTSFYNIKPYEQDINMKPFEKDKRDLELKTSIFLADKSHNPYSRNKMMYSRHGHVLARPQSDTTVVTEKPPLPPGAKEKLLARPLSERLAMRNRNVMLVDLES